MNVLVLGSGGREHALAWRLSLDASAHQVFLFPGNPGVKSPKIEVLHSEKSDFKSVLALAQQNKIDLVVIGPEKYLYEGWVDQFQKESIPAFGPSKAASFLEESKIKSKQFMQEHHIPTAGFTPVNSLTEALKAIESHPNWSGYVLKLSGPALGKGVVVTHDQATARKAAEDFFQHRPPGIEEGMVIEECVSGREVSLFYICLDDQFRFLASACDHKRLLDHDQGPNTGGMGAYSPASWFGEEQLRKAEEDFVIPTLKGMIARGTPFRGVLFLGLMVSEKGASLLEYNTRFGDPETQTFLPLVEGDLSQLLHASATSDHKKFLLTPLHTQPLHSVHVVKAAKGYPGIFGEPIESGQVIQLKEPVTARTQIFFAGVKTQDQSLITSGGRVLGLTSVAETHLKARAQVYQELPLATFAHEHFRKDIGLTAENAEENS